MYAMNGHDLSKSHVETPKINCQKTSQGVFVRFKGNLFLLLAWCALACAGLAAQAAKPAPAPQATPAPAAKPSAPPLKIAAKANATAIDSSLADDAATVAALASYAGRVRELSQPIGKLAEDMQKSGVGGGSLGNFVTDAMRSRAAAKLGQPVLLAITNSGGLRKNEIKAGDVSTSDVFELLPFENALVMVELTGEQLRRFLDVVVARRDAQSGARILYRTNEERKNVIVSVRLGDRDNTAVDIKPDALYNIVTIDYLVTRGGDYAVLQESKNIKPLDLTLRDALLDYIKAETAAGRALRGIRDGRFRFDRSGATGGNQDPQ